MELDFSAPSFDQKTNVNLPKTAEVNHLPKPKEPYTFVSSPSAVNKILLIFPPAYTIKSSRDINPLPPIGIGMLASVLEKKNYEVRILDCLVRGWNQEEETQENKDIVRVGLTNDQIKNLLKQVQPERVVYR